MKGKRMNYTDMTAIVTPEHHSKEDFFLASTSATRLPPEKLYLRDMFPMDAGLTSWTVVCGPVVTRWTNFATKDGQCLYIYGVATPSINNLRKVLPHTLRCTLSGIDQCIYNLLPLSTPTHEYSIGSETVQIYTNRLIFSSAIMIPPNTNLQLDLKSIGEGTIELQLLGYVCEAVGCTVSPSLQVSHRTMM